MPALKDNYLTGDSFTATDANAVADAVNKLNRSGGYSSRPPASFPGRVYYCTDTDATYRDTGSAWERVRFGIGGTAAHPAPSTSGWTALNLGSATIVDDKDSRLLTAPSSATVNIRAEYQTLSPTSNYTVTAYVNSVSANANEWASGLMLRNSGSGALIVFGPGWHSTDGAGRLMGVKKYSSATAHNSNGAFYSTASVGGSPNWLRIRDDGTNRYYEYSFNASDWFPHQSVIRTDFITPDQIGWGCLNTSTGQPGTLRLRSWSVS